jgi:hypothetical protein
MTLKQPHTIEAPLNEQLTEAPNKASASAVEDGAKRQDSRVFDPTLVTPW